MIGALLAMVVLGATPSHAAPGLSAPGHSTHGAGCCGAGMGGRVGELVAFAWQEQALPATPIPEVLDARHQADLKRDVELGKKYSAEVEKELKLSEDQAVQERVNRIGQQLAEIANRTEVRVLWGDRRLNPFQYTFRVVKGDDVNAFSLPGGWIYVYEGLVKYAESDDELAGVLAHEISHASMRHVATLQREASRLQAIQIPLVLAAILTGGRGGSIDALQAAGMGMQAITSGWSQRAETAADLGGLQYMALSRYDATGILTFMERLARDERNRPFIDWGIYRTHPPSRERAAALTAAMREANLPIRRSAVTTTFRTQVKPGENGVVEAWFAGKKIYAFAGTDALTRADGAAKRLDVFFDGTPELFEVVAGEGGAVLGKGRELFVVAPEDAAAAGKNLAEAQEAAVRSIRSSLFGLAFRIWDR